MNTFSTGNDVVLNDIYALKCSETRLMETQYKSQHQFNKTGDVEFVTEGLSDFLSSIGKAFTKSGDTMKKFREAMIKEIKLYYNDFGKFVNKNKKFFEDLPNGSVDFTIEGFNFSVVDSPRINLSEIDKIISDYNQFVTGMKTQLNNPNPEDVNEQLSRYLSDANLAKVRKSMLGYNNDIEEVDFLTVVKKNYRSGEVRPINIRIHKEIIKSIIKNYVNIEKDVDATEKELEMLCLKCRTLSQFLQSTIDSLQKSSIKPVSLGIISVTNTGSISSRDTVEINPSDPNTITTCLCVLRSKYKQLLELQNIAQIVLSERLQALKDELKQNSLILKQCMIEVPKKMLVNSTDNQKKTPVLQKHLDNVPADRVVMLEAMNYTELALENLIFMESEYCSVFEQRYQEELDFFKACMESGMVTSAVLEVTTAKEKFEKIKATMIEFLDKLIGLFRKKVVEYSKRYKKWINDVGEDTFKEKAKEKTDGISAAPYWEAENVSSDIKDIASAISSAASNDDLTKLSFTSQFVNGIDTPESFVENRGELAGYLKNYFRFHKKNQKEVKKEQISGSDLVNKVSGMIKYINDYESFVTSIENTLKRSIESGTNTLAKGAMESFSYMYLENAMASATELGLLEGFELLLEQDEKTGVVTNGKGEPESATSINTPEKEESGDGTPDAKKSGSAEYSRIFQSFFQLAISSLMTAMEERYITYINILTYIAGERPKVDKDGNYVSKEDTKDNTKVEPAKESLLAESFYSKPSKMKGTSLYI